MEKRTPRMTDPVWIDGEILTHGTVVLKVSVEVDRDIFERAVGIKKERTAKARDNVCIVVRTALAKKNIRMGFLKFYTGSSNEAGYFFIIRSARARNVAWEFKSGKLVGEIPPSPLKQFEAQVEQAANMALEATFQDFQEANQLFPEYFGQSPASFNSEAGCGCVPSRVTER